MIVAAVAAYFTFGVSYGWAASAVASGAASSFGFAQFVGAVGWQTLAGVAAGASAGFVAGAITAGSLSGAVKGAVAGAVSGGIAHYHGNAYNLNRVLSEGVGGGISAKILGGRFYDGLKIALAIAGLNYASYRMRIKAGEVADRNPDNGGKKSAGFYGGGTARAGALRTPNPSFGQAGEFKYLPCDSNAGGCQGGEVINPLDVVQSRLGPLPYPPGGVIDHLVESFAGSHDWFRLSTGSYNPMTGTANYYTGFAKIWDGVKNYALLLPSAPFAISGVITTSTWLYIVTNQHLFGDRK